MLLTGLFSLHFYNTQDHQPRRAQVTTIWPLPHQLLIKKMPHNSAHRPSGGTFSQLRFLFSDDPDLCRVGIKLASTVTNRPVVVSATLCPVGAEMEMNLDSPVERYPFSCIFEFHFPGGWPLAPSLSPSLGSFDAQGQNEDTTRDPPCLNVIGLPFSGRFAASRLNPSINSLHRAYIATPGRLGKPASM